MAVNSIGKQGPTETPQKRHPQAGNNTTRIQSLHPTKVQFLYPGLSDNLALAKRSAAPCQLETRRRTFNVRVFSDHRAAGLAKISMPHGNSIFRTSFCPSMDTLTLHSEVVISSEAMLIGGPGLQTINRRSSASSRSRRADSTQLGRSDAGGKASAEAPSCPGRTSTGWISGASSASLTVRDGDTSSWPRPERTCQRLRRRSAKGCGAVSGQRAKKGEAKADEFSASVTPQLPPRNQR
mmetsp:Transcript_19884/g.46533  ORF Transcript_19884/g.46533 Transcript_19884/m.46533 type:complete len:238 (-) Transcript_19884:1700-2413(-)